MRVVIAPDSFKESLSATAVVDAIAQGVLDAAPHAQIVRMPMADGGEGSLEAVLAAGGQRRSASVHNANHQCIDADWAQLKDNSAFIEVAQVAGLEQIPPAQRDPLQASTYGVGELITQALNAGARHIVLGLGGSATNDAGAGMLQALGVRLLDVHGKELPLGGISLASLSKISTENLDRRLTHVTFELAADVSNPLCGPDGATAIFGPQKGVKPQQIETLDSALARFADVCASQFGTDERDTPGAGAAGGLGFALKTFFSASFTSGVEWIAQIAGLPSAMKDADLVFTGEGRIDAQTLFGKTLTGVARHAQRENVPVIALAGSLGPGYERLYEAGITAMFSISPGPITLAESQKNAREFLRARARDCVRIWGVGRSKLAFPL